MVSRLKSISDILNFYACLDISESLFGSGDEYNLNELNKPNRGLITKCSIVDSNPFISTETSKIELIIEASTRSSLDSMIHLISNACASHNRRSNGVDIITDEQGILSAPSYDATISLETANPNINHFITLPISQYPYSFNNGGVDYKLKLMYDNECPVFKFVLPRFTQPPYGLSHVELFYTAYANAVGTVPELGWIAKLADIGTFGVNSFVSPAAVPACANPTYATLHDWVKDIEYHVDLTADLTEWMTQTHGVDLAVGLFFDDDNLVPVYLYSFLTAYNTNHLERLPKLKFTFVVDPNSSTYKDYPSYLKFKSSVDDNKGKGLLYKSTIQLEGVWSL